MYVMIFKYNFRGHYKQYFVNTFPRLWATTVRVNAMCVSKERNDTLTHCIFSPPIQHPALVIFF